MSVREVTKLDTLVGKFITRTKPVIYEESGTVDYSFSNYPFYLHKISGSALYGYAAFTGKWQKHMLGSRWIDNNWEEIDPFILDKFPEPDFTELHKNDDEIRKHEKFSFDKEADIVIQASVESMEGFHKQLSSQVDQFGEFLYSQISVFAKDLEKSLTEFSDKLKNVKADLVKAGILEHEEPK